MADDRGRAPLRPRRPGQYGPRPLARPQPAHLSRDRQDDGEVRRGRRAAAGRGRGVPDAGRVRVDERGGAGAAKGPDPTGLTAGSPSRCRDLTADSWDLHHSNPRSGLIPCPALRTRGLAGKMTLDVGLLLRCPCRFWPTGNVRNTSRARRGVAATASLVTVS